MDALLQALDALKGLDLDMPIAQAVCLLLIAKNEGISLKDLAQKTGVGMASASRYVSTFGKPLVPGRKGFGFVTATEDPLERRKKVISLTAKGRAFVNQLIGAA